MSPRSRGRPPGRGRQKAARAARHAPGRTAQLHVAMHQVVANQLLADDPPQTWQTAQRLAGLGYDGHSIMHMIASLVSEDVYWALMEHRSPTRAPTPGGSANCPVTGHRQKLLARPGADQQPRTTGPWRQARFASCRREHPADAARPNAIRWRWPSTPDATAGHHISRSTASPCRCAGSRPQIGVRFRCSRADHRWPGFRSWPRG